MTLKVSLSNSQWYFTYNEKTRVYWEWYEGEVCKVEDVKYIDYESVVIDENFDEPKDKFDFRLKLKQRNLI